MENNILFLVIKHYKLYLVLIIFLIVIQIVTSTHYQRRNQKGYDHFYLSSIHDAAGEVTFYKGFILFTLENSEEQFWIMPIDCDLHKIDYNLRFEIGDSLWKEKDSNKLNVCTKMKKYTLCAKEF